MIGPHGHDFRELAERLLSFRDQEIVYVPHPGNAGDSVINVGTHLLLEDLGLRYVVGDHEKTYPDRVILCSGGGAFVDVYPQADRFVRRNHKLCRSLVILPHTVRAFGDLIAEMDEHCHVFAREAGSFDYVRAHRTKAHVHLAHDLAFVVSDRRLADLAWRLDAIPLKRGWAWLKMYLKLLRLARSGDRAIQCLRTDVEAKGAASGGGYDLSRWFATGDMSRNACVNSTKILRKSLGLFDRVTTDRLHLAILSTIIGKDVIMRDNSYGKNRSIYDHSIRGYFPNCRFEEAAMTAAGLAPAGG